MRYLIITLLLVLAFLAGCVEIEPADKDTDLGGFSPVEDVPVEDKPVDEAPEEVPDEKIYFTLEAVEGDMIKLAPEAVDPDGDVITYDFKDPFDKHGEWQTQLGDEGTHFVTVVATDGKGGRTVETIKINVARANRPPLVECQQIVIGEGAELNLHDFCTISDEDDNEVVVTYGGWMTSWRYQTTYDDAGTHTVLITASDKKDNEVLHIVKKDITVTVQDVNRAPIFPEAFPAKISATEQDVISLPVVDITDPDGDEITVTFSDPFDDKGIWKTSIDDAGSYSIDVVASDGEMSEKRTVTIELGLLNTVPVLKQIGKIVVDEGETIELPISASDREGDPLTLDITGWMTSDTYKTTYSDAGEYTVKITVTDGVFTASEVVDITVNDVNRPPVFIVPG
ncbi:hypothetical protein GOV11_02760 [Candidatus Woesearchaeota archaeon]|nr:hypothetical protein [Candidatus Woesearchaeota archaeon]